MTPEEYEKARREQGWQLADVELKPGYYDPEHTHEVDGCALIVTGELGITVDGVERIYGAGEDFEMPAGCAHAERVLGTQPMRFIAGIRPVDSR